MATAPNKPIKTVTINYTDPAPGGTQQLQILNDVAGNVGELQFKGKSGRFAATNNLAWDGNSQTLNVRGNMRLTGNLLANIQGNPSYLKIIGGNVGDVLSTDGAGNLSWQNPIDLEYGNGDVANYLPTYIGNLKAGNANLGNAVVANYFVGTLHGIANSAIIADTATISNRSLISDTANYTESANIANVALSVIGSNVNGAVANATYANIAGAAYSVSASNVSGEVANANYATYSGTAYSVSASNVSGEVANATYANIAGTAYSVDSSNVIGVVANANYATYSGTSYSVSASNVSGEVANATHANTASTANISNISYSVSGSNVSGAVANATYANIAGAAYSVSASNVSGEVANATYSNVANVAYSVSSANVSGLGNIATVNLDGNANTILYGNGVFSSAPTISSYNDSNVATFLANLGSNTISTTGNITANNFSGNISIIGNVTGTSPNVTLVAGSYSATMDNAGFFSAPTLKSTNSGGNEGGEIQLAISSNATISNGVIIDSYNDRLRIFESGGSTRGVYIDLSQAAAGVGTLLNNRVSGIVNAGVDVTLGNLQARIPSSGNRSLQISTVSGTYSVYGSSIYNAGGAIGGTNINNGSPVSVTTTPAYLNAVNNFATAGDSGSWTIMDTSAGLAWRISFIIGASFNNNMITIERLV